ncbi:hypothetical protein H4219_001397 [Mycoemilia scoparia]|uniref:Uncharacterized protein n=1 Tax=Mycoemilia scoparia TaxID=417184 RepID=A0A9W8DVE2_9FUNG|nr:hypothetical protein H4219_001397 [Mycoemilia scoparia]
MKLMPLCYNFLNMAGPRKAAVFEKFMGMTDLVPIFGESANRWMPGLILLPAALTYFNVHSRIMNWLVTDMNADDGYGNDNYGNSDRHSGGEGMALIHSARRLAQTKGPSWARHLNLIGVYLLVDEGYHIGTPEDSASTTTDVSSQNQNYTTTSGNVWTSSRLYSNTHDGLFQTSNNIANSVNGGNVDEANVGSGMGPSGIAARLDRRLDSNNNSNGSTSPRLSLSTPLLSNMVGGGAPSSLHQNKPGNSGRLEPPEQNFSFNPWQQQQSTIRNNNNNNIKNNGASDGRRGQS